VYGTGGFAWSYDQLTRTQLAGGTLPPGTDEGAFLWRFGWATGAGVEMPVLPNWSARLEYLYTGFGNRSRDFNASADAFNSRLSLQEVRLGLNYKLFADAPGQVDSLITKAPSLPTEQIWAVHGQTTFVEQYARDVLERHGAVDEFPIIDKPFRLADLARRLRSILHGA
jgi:high affinity Mn2+ porin